jgi:hypothetical protein
MYVQYSFQNTSIFFDDYFSKRYDVDRRYKPFFP